MADDLALRGAADRTRIDVNEDHELRYWMQALDVGEEELRKAVADVGVSERAMREHLGKP